MKDHRKRYVILKLEMGVLFYSELLQINYHELNDAYRMILQTCWRHTSFKNRIISALLPHCLKIISILHTILRES